MPTNCTLSNDNAYLVKNFVSMTTGSEEVFFRAADGKLGLQTKVNTESLSLSQWIVGSLRIGLKLLDEGAMCRMNSDRLDLSVLRSYFMYNIQIADLVSEDHDQLRLNRYDEDFRRLQAMTGRKWHTESTHLLTKHLVQPRSKFSRLAGNMNDSSSN